MLILAVTLSIYACGASPGYEHLDSGFCGRTYSGVQVQEGVAACSWEMPLGSTLVVLGPRPRIVQCWDRGHLPPNTHVDVFFESVAEGIAWLGEMGTKAWALIFWPEEEEP